MNNKENVSRKITSLKQQLESGNYEELYKFWEQIDENGAPIIEEIEGDKDNALVTFIYKGSNETKNVLLYFSFEPENYLDYKYSDYEFERLLDTDVWYKTCKMRNDIRFDYYLIVNDPLDDDWDKRWDRLEQDSLNKNKLMLKDDDGNSLEITYVVMPKADKHQWVQEREEISKGNLDLHMFKSDKLNNERKIWVYTPAEYSESTEPYGFLVLSDGYDYLEISAKAVLDNLINDNKIPPIAAVFIDSNKDRMTELMCNDDFTYFITDEVLPWVRENYNVSDNPQKNIIGGLSLGGLTASFMGLSCPHIFGNVLSQSGSYWYKGEEYDDPEKRNWIAKQFKSREKLNLKFYLNVGILESKKMNSTNQEVRDTLISKGYEVCYEEFNSGHNYLCWGETLANGLMALINTPEV